MRRGRSGGNRGGRGPSRGRGRGPGRGGPRGRMGSRTSRTTVGARSVTGTNTAFTPLRKNMDINCDIGQGIGQFQFPFETEMLPYVTSVNIACGSHAGDPKTMSKMIDLAKENDLNIGALIGYPDLLTNGQREMYLEVDELRSMVLYQLGALNALVHSKGLDVRHVRTAGFLYKQMYTDQLVAETVAKAVAEFSKWITLVGLAGQTLEKACTSANIKMGSEVLIERRYRKDGTVLSFSEAIDGRNYLDQCSERAREIIQTGQISCEGGELKVAPHTIHIPSNRPECVNLASTVRAMIQDPKPINCDRYDAYFSDIAELAN